MATADKQVFSLLALLATDLPGCGTADKVAALERALGEFCRRSRCWRESLTVAMEDGATAAVLAWPCGAYASSVTLVAIDGVSVAGHCCTRLVPSRSLDGAQVLEFTHAPVSGGAWTLTLVGTLQPRRGEIDVPDWMFDRYGDAIADGAKALLKLHARKPYSDPGGAVECKRAFERGIADAACDGAQRERGIA
ncbi:MAG: hypothetical protein WCR06_04850 [bacterium]